MLPKGGAGEERQANENAEAEGVPRTPRSPCYFEIARMRNG
jgi:hypothetical protein